MHAALVSLYLYNRLIKKGGLCISSISMGYADMHHPSLTYYHAADQWWKCNLKILWLDVLVGSRKVNCQKYARSPFSPSLHTKCWTGRREYRIEVVQWHWRLEKVMNVHFKLRLVYLVLSSINTTACTPDLQCKSLPYGFNPRSYIQMSLQHNRSPL